MILVHPVHVCILYMELCVIGDVFGDFVRGAQNEMCMCVSAVLFVSCVPMWWWCFSLCVYKHLFRYCGPDLLLSLRTLILDVLVVQQRARCLCCVFLFVHVKYFKPMPGGWGQRAGVGGCWAGRRNRTCNTHISTDISSPVWHQSTPLLPSSLAPHCRPSPDCKCSGALAHLVSTF